jgi:hypothetical protein
MYYSLRTFHSIPFYGWVVYSVDLKLCLATATNKQFQSFTYGRFLEVYGFLGVRFTVLRALIWDATTFNSSISKYNFM